jgi:type II secretory pathway component GspD/PulD (secretin)
VDIPVLAKFVSEVTGRNFIVDDRVRGKVTVISPTRLTPDEAYLVFESVLQVKGFATLPSGSFTKIVPVRDATQASASGGHEKRWKKKAGNEATDHDVLSKGHEGKPQVSHGPRGHDNAPFTVAARQRRA